MSEKISLDSSDIKKLISKYLKQYLGNLYR